MNFICEYQMTERKGKKRKSNVLSFEQFKKEFRSDDYISLSDGERSIRINMDDPEHLEALYNLLQVVGIEE